MTNETSIEQVEHWMELMRSRNRENGSENSLGYVQALVANKIDVPGKRVILHEDAKSFASQHGMKYFETRWDFSNQSFG